MDNLVEQLNIKNNLNKEENGVYNQFISPINDDISDTKLKKDKIKMWLIIILIISIFVAIGSFLYTKVLNNQVEERKRELSYFDSNPALDIFNENLSGMKSLSKQLKLVNSIYDSKNYISQMLLPIIQSLTESSSDSYVYFNNFSLRRDNSGKFVSVNLSGVALNYPTLYRQINDFKNNSYSDFMTNVKMNSMTLDENNNIQFSASFDIDISTQAFLKYIAKNSNLNQDLKTKLSSGPLFQNNIASTTVLTGSSTSATTSSQKINATSSASSTKKI